MNITRRAAMAAAALITLVAAGCAGDPAGPSLEGDVAIGAADAPVTIVEYLSVTCGACAAFHEEVFGEIQARYIETGRVRYVFRELLTAPQQVSLAGFQIARCGGATPEQYAARLATMLERQREILGGGTAQSVRDQLFAIGRASGLSDEDMQACIADQTAQARVEAVAAQAQREEVSGTPTLFLNGTHLRDRSEYTVDGLSARIDTALAASGAAAQ